MTNNTHTLDIPGQAPGTEYAGFWIRAAAMTLDSYLFVLMSFGLYPLVNTPLKRTWILAAVIAVYRLGCWRLWGATLGYRLLGLRVRDADTFGPLRFGQTVLRYVMRNISILFLGIGVLAVAWDRKKQGWHDQTARTVVAVLPREDGRRREPQHVKGALITLLTPVFIVVLFVTLLIGYYKANRATLVERSKAVMQEGKEFGRTHTARECFDEAARRYRHHSLFAMTGSITDEFFLQASLSTSPPPPELCVGAPPYSSIMASVQWERNFCKTFDPSDDPDKCTRLAREVQKACLNIPKR